MIAILIRTIAALGLILLATSCASSGGKIVGKDKFGMPQYSDATKTRVVRTTAYHAGESDHIKYQTKSAAGINLRYGKIRSAAADWSRYPVGTKFKIKGLPFIYVVDDYGSALVGTNTIDLYKMNGREMKWWGVREVEINILELGDYDLSERILRNRRSHEHCREMHSAIRSHLAESGGSRSHAG